MSMIVCDAEAIRKMVALGVCASKEAGREALRSFELSVTDHPYSRLDGAATLRVVATDSYRLGVHEFGVWTDDPKAYALADAKSMVDALKLVSKQLSRSVAAYLLIRITDQRIEVASHPYPFPVEEIDDLELVWFPVQRVFETYPKWETFGVLQETGDRHYEGTLPVFAGQYLADIAKAAGPPAKKYPVALCGPTDKKKLPHMSPWLFRLTTDTREPSGPEDAEPYRFSRFSYLLMPVRV